MITELLTMTIKIPGIKSIRISSKTQQQMILSPCYCYGCTHAQDNNQTSNHCQWENLWIALVQEPNRIELMLHREQNQVSSTGEVCWKY